MSIRALLDACPVVLAPMEDVTDAPFRAACRSAGAELCVTEFVAAEQLVARAARAKLRASIAGEQARTAIQIYGPDPALLVAAARIAADARPAFVDINCGCWVPRIVARGAGAAWLRDPAAMVAMAGAIVAAVDVPVTVKTRIGWGGGAGGRMTCRSSSCRGAWKTRASPRSPSIAAPCSRATADRRIGAGRHARARP